MLITEFVNKYYMHDSLIDYISYENSTVSMTIDFAFWMQNWYVQGNPETGPLKLEFKNVSFYQCPDQIPLDEVSILEISIEDDILKFALLNDMTDEYLEIKIAASEVIVS